MIDFEQHRERLLACLPPGSVAILPSAGMKVRNNDIEYPYRQDSSFYWLSGLTEPQALIVLSKDHDECIRQIMFLQPRNKEEEIWTGKLHGVSGAKEGLGFTEAYEIGKVDEMIPEILVGHHQVFAPTSREGFFTQLNAWLSSAKSMTLARRRENMESGMLEKVPDRFIDLEPIIKEQRLIKDDAEIALIQKACQISAQAHIKLMRQANEYESEGSLQAKFDGYCRKHNAEGLAYPSIVGSGENGTCLHYEKNSDTLSKGDLVLIDAGCEYQYYASDITRTFPVSGTFSKEQKELYNIVLDAQLAGIAACKPGATYWETEKAASKVMIAGLIKLGLLKGKVDELFDSNALKQFYPHSVGHWVGLDVHDPMPRSDTRGWVKYKPNMVLTIEPGIYIQPDDMSVPKKFRGIGIRIEDVIQITEEGCHVLSKDVPKDIATIEKIMSEGAQYKQFKAAMLLNYHRTQSLAEQVIHTNVQAEDVEEESIAQRIKSRRYHK